MSYTEVKEPTHVIYHGNCPDGYGAAWAAWKKLTTKAQYIPGHYGKPLPELPKDARVLMIDYSCPRAQALELKSKVAEFQILDHHKTAADALSDLEFTKFDLDHSGAYLSWVHFHGEPAPDFIKYIEDRDLWRFKLPYSREVAAAMGSYPMDFVVWEGIAECGMEKLKLDGGVILRFQKQKVEEMVARSFKMEIGGHLVPVANASILFSEVGDRLCMLNPDAPFSAYYYDRPDGKRQWGLRSPGRFDVSKIAVAMGGGGHPGASGFVEDL